MNRKDEYIALRNELEQTPAELEFIASKAITRAKRRKRRSRLIKAPLISFGTAAAAFILLVNLYPAAALAMCKVPILKDFVSAVSFEPSLKAAVEHDYYQVIRETQTQDDVKMTVEYMILDAGHISLFYKLSGAVEQRDMNCEFKDMDGNELQAIINWDNLEADELKEIRVDFIDKYNIPEEFTFTAEILHDKNKESTISETKTPDSTSSNNNPE